jgi:hypothetical protein
MTAPRTLSFAGPNWAPYHVLRRLGRPFSLLTIYQWLFQALTVRMRWQQPFRRRHKRFSSGGLPNQNACLTGAVDFVEPTVDHEGNTPISQPLAKTGTVTIPKYMIQDRNREPIVLHQVQSLLERIGGGGEGAGLSEGLD